MDLRLPCDLKDLIGKDKRLDGAVALSLDVFQPLLAAKQPTFFPEYTDHGVTHVQDVLLTAHGLIHDEARDADVLTPADAAVLVLSTLLHDIAMHIRQDGFVALVTGKAPHKPLPWFGDKPWPEMWKEFESEARRFSGRKLSDLFGEPEPVALPGWDWRRWDDRHHKLVGEFIRRHHARLAHEIAWYGFPSAPDEKPLRLNDVVGSRVGDLADVSGLVARSHGVALRPCLEYLRDQYRGSRIVLGAHPPFLMVLLRIGDYLQLQAERAPREILRVQRLRSPLSQGEWRAHEAIRELRYAEDDPEALFIDAHPTDLKTYLKLERLLAGLQAELDASWAVLGEEYGRFERERLDRLGITLRRVKTNLGEPKFRSRLPYQPFRCVFDTAATDLLPLLIGPLYGDRPAFAIRELIQNAVDAVRELRQLAPDGQWNGREIQLAEQDADVVAEMKFEGEQAAEFCISDRGVGMLPETIRDYFLKAGASFRQSDAWRRQFEDADGHSKVLRSGRFGVGALSVFMLGDQIEVSTRHASAERGVRFTAGIDTDPIQLDVCERPVGTTIRVPLSEASKGALTVPLGDALGWYLLRDPKVRLRAIGDFNPRTLELTVDSPPATAEIAPVLPEPGQPLPHGWHRIDPPGYQEIHWSYHGGSAVTCNGLLVSSEQQGTLWSDADEPLWFNHFSVPWLWPIYNIAPPNLSVFDPDGRLPLNLQRDKLNLGACTFKDRLLDAVVQDFLAFALVFAPKQPVTSDRGGWTVRSEQHPGVNLLPSEAVQFQLWAHTEHGITFSDPTLIRLASVDRRVLLFPCDLIDAEEGLIHASLANQLYHAAVSLQHIEWRATLPHLCAPISVFYRDNDIWRSVYRLLCNGTPEGAQLDGIRVVISRVYWRNRELDRHALGILGKNGLAMEWSNEHWAVLRLGHCGEPILDYKHLAKGAPAALALNWPILAAEWYPVELEEESEPSPLARGWLRHFGSATIPFEPRERRAKLARAYKELQEFVTKWERIQQERQEQEERDRARARERHHEQKREARESQGRQYGHAHQGRRTPATSGAGRRAAGKTTARKKKK